mmetsp:Transcript_1541/g.161  ORF Transcript_1541/g.161 Transcript_1541/m.161 type:complete len:109 (+) Transcript_1541:610-936(+)
METAYNVTLHVESAEDLLLPVFHVVGKDFSMKANAWKVALLRIQLRWEINVLHASLHVLLVRGRLIIARLVKVERLFLKESAMSLVLRGMKLIRVFVKNRNCPIMSVR